MNSRQSSVINNYQPQLSALVGFNINISRSHLTSNMVLHFPAKLTDEEEALQLKYAKLRRKKKQLQEVRHENGQF